MQAKHKQGFGRKAEDGVTLDARPADAHGLRVPDLNHHPVKSPVATNPTLQPGDVLLGKYRVERILGQGGMGIVVAAQHIELGEMYAIKVMLPKMLESPEAHGRFLREARASARLKGDHVARVHDIGYADDGMLFMVMEYLEGMDLARHIKTHGRLSVQDAVTIVMQACEGISEAHEQGIVHRDIKPANLFLARKRKTLNPFVKVLDFGISKELELSQLDKLTQSGAMLGTPLYMSPEQMTRSRHVDTRTDIWSLGVVLYELVTGQVPFAGDTLTEVVHRVMSTSPQPIRVHVASLPRALEVVIERCLEKDPAKRYQSVDALAKALERVQTGESVEDGPEDPTHYPDTLEAPAPNATSSDAQVDLAATEPASFDALSSTVPVPDKPAELPSDTIKHDVPTTHQDAATSTLSTNDTPRRKTSRAVVGVAAIIAMGGLIYVGVRSLSKSNAGENNAPMGTIGTVIKSDDVSPGMPQMTAAATSAPQRIEQPVVLTEPLAAPSARGVVSPASPVVSTSVAHGSAPHSTPIKSAATPANVAPTSTTSSSVAPPPRAANSADWRQGPL